MGVVARVPGLLSTRPFSTRHMSTRHQSTSDICLPRPFSTKTLVYHGHFSTIDTSLPRLLSTQTLLYHGLLSTSDICLPDISLPSSKNRHFSTTKFFSINNKKISQLRYFEYVVCFDLYLYHIISICLFSNKQYYLFSCKTKQHTNRLNIDIRKQSITYFDLQQK